MAVAAAPSAVVATLATAAAAALRHVGAIIAERDARLSVASRRRVVRSPASVAYWLGPAPFFAATAAIVAHHHQCHNIFTTKHSHANRKKIKT